MVKMCGRTICTLNLPDYRRACTYTNRQGRRVRPRIRRRGGAGGAGRGSNRGGGGGGQTTGGQTRPQNYEKTQTDQCQSDSRLKPKEYMPSFNMSPTQIMPVLISTSHFDAQTKGDQETAVTGERELFPMQWGLIPSWHKGSPAGMGYKMNNCRSEGMTEKVSFKKPFERGRRCVVLADGFYEWKTDKDGKKQPYFIYFKQDKTLTDLHIETVSSSTIETDSEEQDAMCEEEEEEITDPGQEWTGHKVLTMAGLFDIWKPDDGSDPLYTFTVITVASHPSFEWLHHRQPAVLDGEEAVRDWLDYGTVPAKQALSLIKPVDALAWHPVSTQVNNSRYKEADCIKPIDLDKPVRSASSNLMASWLSKANTTKSNLADSNHDTDNKKGDKKRPCQSKPSKPSPMMAWLKKANSDDKLQKMTGGPSAAKKAKIH